MWTIKNLAHFKKSVFLTFYFITISSRRKQINLIENLVAANFVEQNQNIFRANVHWMLEEFLAVDVSAPSQDELFQKIEGGKKKVGIPTCTIVLNFDMLLQVIIILVVVYDMNIFTSRVRSSIPNVIIK